MRRLGGISIVVFQAEPNLTARFCEGTPFDTSYR